MLRLLTGGLVSTYLDDVSLVEFMCAAFIACQMELSLATRGLCCCVPVKCKCDANCSSAITSLWLLILQKSSGPHSVSDFYLPDSFNFIFPQTSLIMHMWPSRPKWVAWLLVQFLGTATFPKGVPYIDLGFSTKSVSPVFSTSEKYTCYTHKKVKSVIRKCLKQVTLQ